MRRKISKAHVEDVEDYNGEESRQLYIDCHYLLYQYLSLSLNHLSPTTRSKTKWKYKTKEKRRRTPTLYYTKREETYLLLSIPHLRSIYAVFIDIGKIWKARRSHASKIIVWAHQKAAFPQHCHGKIRVDSPKFWSRGSSGFQHLLCVSCFAIFGRVFLQIRL